MPQSPAITPTGTLSAIPCQQSRGIGRHRATPPRQIASARPPLGPARTPPPMGGVRQRASRIWPFRNVHQKRSWVPLELTRSPTSRSPQERFEGLSARVVAKTPVDALLGPLKGILRGIVKATLG